MCICVCDKATRRVKNPLTWCFFASRHGWQWTRVARRWLLTSTSWEVQRSHDSTRYSQWTVWDRVWSRLRTAHGTWAVWPGCDPGCCRSHRTRSIGSLPLESWLRGPRLSSRRHPYDKGSLGRLWRNCKRRLFACLIECSSSMCCCSRTNRSLTGVQAQTTVVLY